MPTDNDKLRTAIETFRQFYLREQANSEQILFAEIDIDDAQSDLFEAQQSLQEAQKQLATATQEKNQIDEDERAFFEQGNSRTLARWVYLTISDEEDLTVDQIAERAGNLSEKEMEAGILRNRTTLRMPSKSDCIPL
jgi:hypothetical protein